jgi:hypothetical protein
VVFTRLSRPDEFTSASGRVLTRRTAGNRRQQQQLLTTTTTTTTIPKAALRHPVGHGQPTQLRPGQHRPGHQLYVAIETRQPRRETSTAWCGMWDAGACVLACVPSQVLFGTWRLTVRLTVDREEVDRLRKRFMKLDKVRFFKYWRGGASLRDTDMSR